MKKIKVLYVIGRYPKGGVGSFIENTLSLIDNSKFEISFLINDSVQKSDFPQKMLRKGMNTTVLPELKLKTIFSYFKKIKEFYKKNQFDIVHVHSPNVALFNLISMKFNNYSVKQLIIHSHSTKSSDILKNRIRNIFLISPLKYLNINGIACSEDAGNFLFAKKIKFKIIKNAINLKDFSFDNNIREKVRADNNWSNQFIIGHVGNFISVKNHDFMLKIFKEILKINPNSKLILIGEGPERKKIEEEIRILNLDEKVSILGKRSDVNILMQGFDHFILPSKFEGVPLVGIEAQAAGLSCHISSNVSKDIACTDLVKFKSIKSNPIDWATSIIEDAYSNKVRSSQVKTLAEKGYSIENEVRKLEKIYEKLPVNSF